MLRGGGGRQVRGVGGTLVVLRGDGRRMGVVGSRRLGVRTPTFLFPEFLAPSIPPRYCSIGTVLLFVEARTRSHWGGATLPPIIVGGIVVSNAPTAID